MKEKGAALLAAVISIMVLMLISGVLYTIALSYAKIETSEEKGIIAYHMAEAGIQYGIAEVLKDDLGSDDPLPSLAPLNNPFGQGGVIVVTLEKSEFGDSFIVKSTATYNGVTRKKEAEYLYEIELEEDTDEEEAEGE